MQLTHSSHNACPLSHVTKANKHFANKYIMRVFWMLYFQIFGQFPLVRKLCQISMPLNRFMLWVPLESVIWFTMFLKIMYLWNAAGVLELFEGESPVWFWLVLSPLNTEKLAYLGQIPISQAKVSEVTKLPVMLLTFMLLVDNFANTKWCKNPEKWLKPWQMGTHLRVLGESFQMNTKTTGFQWFFKNLAFLCFGRK